jgi:hypothetical protein
MYLTGNFLATHTAIGTHSRFTRQFLGYAQREQLARALFYDFPVTLSDGRIFGKKGRLVEAAFLKRPLSFDGQSLAS